MRIPRRLWLSAVVLLAITAGGWLLAPRGRITQENFDRIRDGMTVEEVVAVLGELPGSGLGHLGLFEITWHEGPNRITVGFAIEGMTVRHKVLQLATPWENVTWYAKKGVEKIGLRRD